MTVLLFKIDDNYYAIDIAYVHEIVRRQKIVPMAGQSSCVAGITDVRGNIYTCVDLSSVMYGKRGKWASTQLFLLTNCDDSLISFIVDDAENVVDIDESVVKTDLMAFGTDRTLDGIFEYNGNLIGLLNIESTYKMITG